MDFRGGSRATYTIIGVRARLRAAAIAGLLASAAAPGDAQETFPRPRLRSGADTNDWEVYFDRGVEALRGRSARHAEPALYWASRLDPTRAEPLFARWVAFWLRDPSRYLRYLQDDPAVLEAKDVRQAESLLYQALLRNPLVFQGLEVVVMDQLPGRWGEDPLTLAILAYAELDFPRALRQFRVARERNPQKYGWLRYDRALVFTAMQQYDSALAELQQLLEERREREAEQLVRVYESKAFLEYAVALLEAARGRTQVAQQALERALVEDLGFYQAHTTMGDLALHRGDAAGAVRAFGQAVDLSPPDPALHHRYGTALLRAGRPADAAGQVRRAIELEPYFADPYLVLGRALEQDGDSAGAVGAYQRYLARARRNDPGRRQVSERVQALTAASGRP